MDGNPWAPQHESSDPRNVSKEGSKMRQPKPFFRKFTGTWYVKLSGHQINLGADKKIAFEKYHELMASRGRATISFARVAQLLDAYLDWLHEHRAPGTYDKARHYLNLFAQHLGSGFRVAAVESIHVLLWVEGTDWTDTTLNDAISIVQRAFAWAVKRGHIAKSPVAIVEGKPRKRRREAVFSRDDWKTVRGAVSDRNFGDFLDFMWDTGCRPIETRQICASHVDVRNSLIIFPPSESKGQKHERVIFLSDTAVAICRRLIELHPTGPLFCNTKDRPWTKDSINCRFRRISVKVGFPCCAYAIRHSYATEGLKQGMDSLTLAQLMGHADTSMLSRYYAHLARNPAYLREQAKKVRT